MIDWVDSLTTLQLVFFIFGALGLVMFLIQIILMMIGIDDADTDVDADVDMDGDAGTDVGHVHADSDVDFKVLSLQGVVAFFMMTGWVGLAMNRSFGCGTAISIAIGVAAGICANLLIAKALQAFKKVQSSGTMDLKNAIGEEGSVYLSITKDVPGKVRVAVQEHLKVFDAVSEDGQEIPTDSRVVVVRVVKGNTMVVKNLDIKKKRIGRRG